jgi:alpha-N-arabinofuranosidase
MERRGFLKAAAASTAAVVLSRRGALAQQADSHIEILVDEPIGTIAPEVYGHFTEHLGSVIYDGIYVGEGSKIANQHGLRSALIEKMRAIHAPMVRWPGGCFADSYDWRDGVGPKDKRPRRTNFWTDSFTEAQKKQNIPQIYEPNEFGTDDFVRFCKLCGAEPYIAGNVRSLTPLDFDHWVEYCNSPKGTTTLAEMRAAAGEPEPYNVRYWGVGNESWGCGGNFDPEDYAIEFKRYTTWVPSYGVNLRFVASGPNSDEQAWTRGFFNKLFHGQPCRGARPMTGMRKKAMRSYSTLLTGTNCARRPSASRESFSITGRRWANSTWNTRSNSSLTSTVPGTGQAPRTRRNSCWASRSPCAMQWQRP